MLKYYNGIFIQGLVETVINFVSNKNVLQQFRAVILAICAVEKSAKIDIEVQK